MSVAPGEAPKPFVDQAMRTRTRTALLLAPIGIASIIFLPPLWFGLLIGGLFGIGLWEWSRLSGWESTWQRVVLVLLQLSLMAWLALDGEDALKQVIDLGMPVLLAGGITPQNAAGPRIEPEVSEPIASGTRPAATAAAEPLDEPPVKCAMSQGLRAGGNGPS